MDVPERASTGHVALNESDRMSSPGANRSTQVPQLEKYDRESYWLVAPTLVANGADPGEKRQASPLALPAAVVMVTPAWTARVTASSSAWLCGPLMLRLATAGVR